VEKQCPSRLYDIKRACASVSTQNAMENTRNHKWNGGYYITRNFVIYSTLSIGVNRLEHTGRMEGNKKEHRISIKSILVGSRRCGKIILKSISRT
jgi:hypothetical protein